jgi:hypothetical protein
VGEPDEQQHVAADRDRYVTAKLDCYIVEQHDDTEWHLGIFRNRQPGEQRQQFDRTDGHRDFDAKRLGPGSERKLDRESTKRDG